MFKNTLTPGKERPEDGMMGDPELAFVITKVLAFVWGCGFAGDYYIVQTKQINRMKK